MMICVAANKESRAFVYVQVHMYISDDDESLIACRRSAYVYLRYSIHISTPELRITKVTNIPRKRRG